MRAPFLEMYQGIAVVRDDLLRGGTKCRAIARLIEASAAAEFVYASPAYGYAQLALAVTAAEYGRKATIFTARRKVPHALTRTAAETGANVHMVEFGYLTVVQARARAYADSVGAYLVPFGLDTPMALEAIADAARLVAYKPTEVWCAAGSGVLTRALQRAWPEAAHYAVQVGKAANVGPAQRIVYPRAFECSAQGAAPFPSAANYDAKAWEIAKRRAKPGALFWNVAG